jgi:mycothiol synthase
VIAVFLSTVRDIDYGLKCFIKIFLIAKEYRRKGLGSSIISEILIKLKDLAIPLISYGASPPRYWEPGLDLRHTELYFFFKKHKFRERGLRFNLTVDLNTFQQQPKSQLNDFKFMRARVQDLDDLYLFVKNNFPSQVWPEEVKTSFDFDPPNTFVAKDMNEKIVGWATYSNFYPGSFGPTGVVQTLHGKGLGKELLYWCLDAIKMSGLDICTIMWVTGDTRKFYSKAAGAYIHPIYYVLERKIK